MYAENKTIIVVLGMHRSGTSVLTRGLKVFGVELGNNLIAPQNDNEKGFWENLDINALNINILKHLGSSYDSLEPIFPEFIKSNCLDEFKHQAIKIIKNLLESNNLFGLKDPRIARLLPFWQSVFNELQLNVKYIIALRNPISVAHSLEKRDGFSLVKSYLLWQEYTLLALTQTISKPRVIVEYDRLLLNPHHELNRIARKLHLQLDVKSLQFIEFHETFLDKSLRHNYFDSKDILSEPDISNDTKELYNLAYECAIDHEDIESEKSKLVLHQLFLNLKNNENILRYLKNTDEKVSQYLLLQKKIESLEIEVLKQDIKISKLLETIAIPDSILLKEQINSEWYLQKNKDVAESNIDPYEHWITTGIGEGRTVTSDPISLSRKLMLEREELFNKTIVKKEQDFSLQLSQFHLNNAQAQIALIKALTEQQTDKLQHSNNIAHTKLLNSLFDKKEYELLEQVSQLQLNNNETIIQILKEKQYQQEEYMHLAIEAKERNTIERFSQLEQLIQRELLNLNNKLNIKKTAQYKKLILLIQSGFLYLINNFKWGKIKHNKNDVLCSINQNFLTVTENINDIISKKSDFNSQVIKLFKIFDGNDYLYANPNLLKGGINPYEHFMCYGWQENLNIYDFNQHDIEHLVEVVKAKIKALEIGISVELIRSQCGHQIQRLFMSFDGQKYLDCNQDLVGIEINPYEHFMREGFREGRQISSVTKVPISIREPNNIISYLTKPCKHGVQNSEYSLTNLMYHIWSTRVDLHNNFNINTHEGLIEFSKWLLLSGQNEYGLTPNVYPRNLLKRLANDQSPVRAKAQFLLNEQIKSIKVESDNNFHTNYDSVSANLIGYANGEYGMGEHIRMVAHSLNESKVPFCIINQNTEIDGVQNTNIKNWMMDTPKHPINIFHVNADVFLPLYFKLGEDFFHKRYNIGYWAWELSECPNEFDIALNMVDEIWSISNFVTDSFKSKAPVPVITMPLAVSVPDLSPAIYNKSFYGLPEDKFIFLFNFDASSYLERKNPIAVVHAFKFAFPNKKEKVHLVLKTMNTRSENILWEKLLEAMSNDERITLINKRLPRDEILGLNLACDAFISLHRSEGFGRCVAEAMAYGKPVIVTNYSGTKDFANEDTACVVDYTLIPVLEGSYPFSKGQVWAEANIVQAAKYMQKLVNDKEFRINKAEAGQKFVLENFNKHIIGQKYLERLSIIHNRKFNKSNVENKKVSIGKKSTTLFTIVSKNYLAYARTLLKSVKETHPEFSLFVCLVDTTDNYFNPSEEIFTVIQADQLNIPTFADMAIRYDIMELNTAVKPFMFRWLFDNLDIENAIYLDPDIKVYSSLDELLVEFKLGASVILTPHISKPLEDEKLPSDHGMLQAGVFNLGFIAAKRCPETLDFMAWWGKKLLTHAVSDFSKNLFTDQKWCDLAPCFLNNLKVIKHPGYNVAYWNLSHNNIEKRSHNCWQVNNKPLVFFHFSGIDPEKREMVSKHQNRFNWSDLNNDCRDLFTDYIDELLANEWKTSRDWPYAYGNIGDIELTTIMRHFYRKENPTPWDVINMDIESYLVNLCNQPFSEKDKRITYLMNFIYSVRQDLQNAFNLLSTQGRDEFVNWFKCVAPIEYSIHQKLVPLE